MNFMHDQLTDGRTFRLFNLLNDFNRKGLGIKAEFLLRAIRVILALDQIIEWHDKPNLALRAGYDYFGSTMARNLSARTGSNWLTGAVSSWSSFSRAIRSKMPMSSVTTVQYATAG